LAPGVAASEASRPSVVASFNYFGTIRAVQPVRKRAGNQYALDLQYACLFNEAGTEARAGCQNCTDEAPPLTFNNKGEGLYDYRGALVYVRMQYRS